MLLSLVELRIFAGLMNWDYSDPSDSDKSE